MIYVERLRRNKSDFNSYEQSKADKSQKTWGTVERQKGYILLELKADIFIR